jgi:hypothetical protein
VAIVVSLSYVRKLRAYRATQTIRVLEDDLRAAQNRELSKTDQKLGVLTCTIETGMGSMIFPRRVQRMIDLKNSTCTDKYPRGSNSVSAGESAGHQRLRRDSVIDSLTPPPKWPDCFMVRNEATSSLREM